MGFIFGGNTNETPDTIKQKRELVRALMGGRTPQNIGEGISAIGDGIVANVMGSRADKAEQAGLASASSAFDGMLGPASTASSASPATTGNTSYRDAIASIESKGSGDYAAVGPTHPEMGRALGRYQIMESNIGPWSKEVLGRAVTPDEFMKNPQLQDQIFDGKFQSYVNKYGLEGAAQAWLGGPGGVGKLDRKDSLGTSIAEYGQRFTKALGTAQPGNLDPNVGGRWTPETKDNVYDPAAIQQKLMSIKGDQVASLNPQTNPAYPQTNPAILQAGGMYTPQTTDYRSPNPGVMDKNIEGMAYAPTQKPSGVVQALNNMATGSIPPNAPMASTRGNSGMDVWQGRANQGTATDGTQLTRLADGSVQRTNRFGVTERMDGNGGGSVQSALMAGAQQPQQQAANPAPMAQQAPASPQVAQALQSPLQASQTGGIDPRALAVLSNPFATDGQRMVAQALIKQQQEANDPMRKLEMEKSQLEFQNMKNPPAKWDVVTGKDGSVFRINPATGQHETIYGPQAEPLKPTGDIQEYEYAKKQGFTGTFPEYQQQMKKAGAQSINIDQKAESQFDKTLAEQQAKSFDAMATDGMNAKADLALVGQLGDLLKGQGGTLTGISGVLAGIGIGGEGMGDLQAADALIEKLVPSQRAPGSGTMSDADIKMFRASLPSLWKSPGGNQIILSTMQGLAQYKQAQGDIAQRVMMGEIDRKEAVKLLRELPNPLESFRSSKPQSSQASPQAAPQVTPQAAPAKTNTPPIQIQSIEDYNRVPSGSQYVDPQGVVRVKK